MAAKGRPLAAAAAGLVICWPAGAVSTGTYGGCGPPLPYWRAIWLSTRNAWPGMAKLLVIRCVVPLIVAMPAAATTSQINATRAL
jgi:hypothetical protein